MGRLGALTACAEEERDLTRPEGVLGDGLFPVLLTHTRSPSERYVKRFRPMGSWERIDYVRDVKVQPPRARIRVTSSRGSADPGRHGLRAR